MKRIALLHTVSSVLEGFESRLRGAIQGELKVHTILDDFLATDPAETGIFSDVNKQRLANDLRNCELTGADVIVSTCSTLTPTISVLRPSFRVPVVAIDDAMCSRAAALGSRILVLATARSTIEPTSSSLRIKAAALGKRVELEHLLSLEAFSAMKAGDMASHDHLVEAMARKATGFDVIVLAQASMAHLSEPLSAVCGIPVLGSTPLCLEEIRTILNG
jgi:Asp/Glu/hydantoin racemase